MEIFLLFHFLDEWPPPTLPSPHSGRRVEPFKWQKMISRCISSFISGFSAFLHFNGGKNRSNSINFFFISISVLLLASSVGSNHHRWCRRRGELISSLSFVLLDAHNNSSTITRTSLFGIQKALTRLELEWTEWQAAAASATKRQSGAESYCFRFCRLISTPAKCPLMPSITFWLATSSIQRCCCRYC